MNKTTAVHILTLQGNHRVPCSRYGYDTESCARVAYYADRIIAGETGTSRDASTLENVMGMVVNDSDGLAYLLAAYGREYGMTPSLLAHILGPSWREYARQ